MHDQMVKAPARSAVTEKSARQSQRQIDDKAHFCGSCRDVCEQYHYVQHAHDVDAIELPKLKSAFKALEAEHPLPKKETDADFDPFSAP